MGLCEASQDETEGNVTPLSLKLHTVVFFFPSVFVQQIQTYAA